MHLFSLRDMSDIGYFHNVEDDYLSPEHLTAEQPEDGILRGLIRFNMDSGTSNMFI